MRRVPPKGGLELRRVMRNIGFRQVTDSDLQKPVKMWKILQNRTARAVQRHREVAALECECEHLRA